MKKKCDHQPFVCYMVGATGPMGPQGEMGPQGIQGERGATGPQGEMGPSEVIRLGKVLTGYAESDVQIVDNKAGLVHTLDFIIPRGKDGIDGEKGDIGPTGPKGEDGTSVTILGSYDSEQELEQEHPAGRMGASYMVGDDLYVWSANEQRWVDVGTIKGPKGDTGPKGEPGEMGPQGEQGERGEQGLRGPQGEPGPKGETGERGPRGEKGDTGAQGPRGEQGLPGERGPQGEQGAPGPTGWPGEKGDPGPKGDTGDTGPQGPPGPKGEKGEQGPRGEQGPEGPRGERGEVGPPGVRGEKGEQGIRGEPGVVGPMGPPGEKGDTGPAGPQGPKGDVGQGETISLGVVSTGDASTFAKVIDHHVGLNHRLDFVIPRGINGSPGEQGPPGPAGPAGPTGERGEIGPPGMRGEKGDKGERGEPGAEGPMGPPGDPGPLEIPTASFITFNEISATGGTPVTAKARLPIEMKITDVTDNFTLNDSDNTITIKTSGTYRIDFVVQAHTTSTISFQKDVDIVAVGFRKVNEETVYAGGSVWDQTQPAVKVVGQGIVTSNENEEYELVNLGKYTIYLESPNIDNLSTESSFINPVVTLIIQKLK